MSSCKNSRSFMAIKFFLAELFKKCTRGQICPPPTKIGLSTLDAMNFQKWEHFSDSPGITRDRTLDLPFFLNCMHITSLKYLPYPASCESLPYWFQGNFAAVFVLNYWSRGFLLSAFANHFELRCEPKHLMLLYYKIYPCSSLYEANSL